MRRRSTASLADLTGERTRTRSPTTANRPTYRHCRLLDHGRGDWAMTIARRYLYDTADAVRLEALAGGSWAPLADLVGKLIREERYHRMHAGCLARPAGPEPTASRAIGCSRALEPLGPDAATVFTPLPGEPALVEAGVLAAPMTELEARWRASIAPILANAGPADAATDRDPGRGRLDHGEAFRWLWGEFTSVRRADRGATW